MTTTTPALSLSIFKETWRAIKSSWRAFLPLILFFTLIDAGVSTLMPSLDVDTPLLEECVFQENPPPFCNELSPQQQEQFQHEFNILIQEILHKSAPMFGVFCLSLLVLAAASYVFWALLNKAALNFAM